MKDIALDTNFAISFLNGNKETAEALEEYDRFFLPVTVCGELLFGARNSSRVSSNLERYVSFINSCHVLEIGFEVSDIYSEIRLSLKKKGRPIPENDIWIAAICFAYGVPLFTNDKHFSFVDGLEIG
jgi:tRNA(fMet)-specific endonuclease VapC